MRAHGVPVFPGFGDGTRPALSGVVQARPAILFLALVACGARTGLGTPRGDAAGDAGALRQIAPLSTSVVTTQRPTFRWTGAIEARLEVCRDRACSDVEATLDVSGTSATLASDLAPGVHYWRLHPIAGGNVKSATTAVWEVRVPHRSSPRDTSWGVFPDFDGDGFADLLEVPLVSFDVTIFRGSSSGVHQDDRVVVTPPGSKPLIQSVAAVGDLDGDGFGDLAVGAWPDQPLVVVYRGGPKGIDPEKPSWVLASPGGDDGLIFGSNLASAGDLNGDGYADMIVAEDADASFGGPPGRFLIYFGGPDGPASTPSIILHPTDPAQLAASGIAEAGDVDGDGFPDLVALAPHADETGGPGLYLYRGGPSGPSDATRVLLASLPIDPDCFTPPLSPTPGDLNGDGFADVVVGLSDCLQQHPAPGRELVVYGGPTPTVTIFSKPTDFGGSGFAVHIAWDVDGDGFDDLVAGASAGAQASGGVVYWGSPEGVSDDARTAFGVSSSTDTSGFAVTAGDLDGDGRDDLAIGTMLTGTVTTFSGGPSGLSPGATLVPKSNGMDYEPWLR